MSGITRWMAGSLTAMVVAAASLATLAGPAQAYNRGSCDVLSGAANIYAVDDVNMDGGRADFGDRHHAGGVPWGNAVVCWARNGSAMVVGRLFADRYQGVTEPKVEITYFNNGVEGAPGSSAGTHGWSFKGSNADSRFVLSSTGAETVDRVRIRLFADGVLVKTAFRSRD
jgi:hypothetical protein